MSLHIANIRLRPGHRSRIEIDGHELQSARAVTIEDDVNSFPTVSVELLLPEVVIDGHVIVTVPDRTRTDLIALGWTPPQDTP